MRLLQATSDTGARIVIATAEDRSWIVKGWRSVYDLARAAAGHSTLSAVIRAAGEDGPADPVALLTAGRVVCPIDHPDPAHVHVTGTGLTHLGSAETRDAMHRGLAAAAEEALTDSMKMFRLGLEGGKPGPGEVGVQPEWFYKGDGSTLAAPGEPLVSPAFASDAGEEPEVAGIYIVGDDARPYRIGFALGNELSDHVMERQNYLWLAHSKLRPSSIGPEILLGDLPPDIRGTSRIVRAGEVIFEQPFLTGERNMSHSVANLQAHHFKYPFFRRPGDVHVHYFGSATLSFAAGVRTAPGDLFEIQAPAFGLPLANPLASARPEQVRVLAL